MNVLLPVLLGAARKSPSRKLKSPLLVRASEYFSANSFLEKMKYSISITPYSNYGTATDLKNILLSRSLVLNEYN